MRFALVSLLLFLSCGGPKKKEKPIVPSPKAEMLEKVYNDRLARAFELSRPQDGWLEIGCDGMLWAGKYSCGGGNPDVTAAEYKDQPGRFNRMPPPRCGVEQGNSKTTWSRDMGMGLMVHSWCKKDLEPLKRHAAYGKANNWIMGSPFADGRVFYVPSIVGILYELIYYLGGPDSNSRMWPSLYPSGLDDYQAHLQMLDIWLRGDVVHSVVTKETTPLDVSQEMYNRIMEHSKREPECPFYQYMAAIYDSGDLNRTIDLLLEQEHPKCQYVRGDQPDKVDLSEWLFVAKLSLDKLPK